MSISLTKPILPANGASQHRSYKLTALDHYREPLAAATVEVSIEEGAGSFDGADPGLRTTRVTTDAAGEAHFDWFETAENGTPQGTQTVLRLTSADERAIDLELEEQVHVEMPWI